MKRLVHLGLGLLLACTRGETLQDSRSPSLPDTAPPRYATDFAQTESPMSEGGRWLNGGTDGEDWTDVSTAPQRAIGHQVAARNTDATAILNGNWGPNQGATATVFTIGVLNELCRSEVELRLRSSLSPHSNRGYVIRSKASTTDMAYLIIVRWNGVLGDATTLLERYGAQYGVKTGDVIKATIVGDRITAYKNGVVMGRVSDDTYAAGNPGIGFSLENSRAGCPGTNDRYGFSRFSATDVLDP